MGTHLYYGESKLFDIPLFLSSFLTLPIMYNEP